MTNENGLSKRDLTYAIAGGVAGLVLLCWLFNPRYAGRYPGVLIANLKADLPYVVVALLDRRARSCSEAWCNPWGECYKGGHPCPPTDPQGTSHSRSGKLWISTSDWDHAMSLKGIAQETLSVQDRGSYVAPSGRTVDISELQQSAVAGTRLYRPEELKHLLSSASEDDPGSTPRCEVTDEKTQEAARRLVQDEGVDDLVLLNFASARNVGGGFLTGARAQEEDLTRCSGLYRCLETQMEYYETNRANSSLLYTDHMIYSPRVPWFRVTSREFLESPYLASVITAPAPNAGQFLKRNRDGQQEVSETLQRRSGYVLAVARDRGHRSLLLGAWGCGVFRNDPAIVADAFMTHLQSSHFTGAFDRVTFAVYDPTKEQGNLKAFRKRVG